ncbi:hypothetical protein TWF106_001868 [Orbilia oligospora]|uniref:Uncharacterized protein n=1 Tax=Orbilia oligospora TaxID=2813651 RepID=A0A7C8Q9P4_ORBOL|nr:hypothetical protein TWF106_001868 [Orbilia oligospora]
MPFETESRLTNIVCSSAVPETTSSESSRTFNSVRNRKLSISRYTTRRTILKRRFASSQIAQLYMQTVLVVPFAC